MEKFDAVIIGSGINALVAGAILAKDGWQVAICERNNRPGGAIRTDSSLVPGFTLELLSSWHPLFLGGPAYQKLAPDLAARSLTYLNTTSPTGVLCQDGSAVLSTDPAATAAQFELLGDGAAWESMITDFAAKADLAFGLLGTDFWRKSALKFGWGAYRQLGRRGLMATGAEVLEPAAPYLDRNFSSPVSKALLAPWALHNGLGPDDAGSAFITRVIAAAIAWGGMPVPVGGGINLVNALLGIISDAGGQLFLNADVNKLILNHGKARGVVCADGRSINASRAVLASVTPQFLYEKLLGDTKVEAADLQAAKNFRYGRAALQVHIAMNEKPKWSDARLGEVAIVHVLDGMDSLSESVNAANRGFLPRRPTIVVGQPVTVDPSRAPEGESIIWIQLQENPRVIRGDLAGKLDAGDGSWSDSIRDAYVERVIDQLRPHISNLDSASKFRLTLGPAQLTSLNTNLVGGDPYAGDCRIDQFAPWRPLGTGVGHRTPVADLWQIGASTHPGPGLSGSSGYLVATRLTGKG
ncbi:dehydrosqualene desaturase [mine drainage metagenome]|uniref:Pyridine nucleotide-disulfide oxidoreductase domain-containing protein 2 n=1 Tax=mine drainage metagenome TaxID=410659 RepID=A0A1J5QCD2_9ZZZZ